VDADVLVEILETANQLLLYIRTTRQQQQQQWDPQGKIRLSCNRQHERIQLQRRAPFDACVPSTSICATLPLLWPPPLWLLRRRTVSTLWISPAWREEEDGRSKVMTQRDQ